MLIYSQVEQNGNFHKISQRDMTCATKLKFPLLFKRRFYSFNKGLVGNISDFNFADRVCASKDLTRNFLSSSSNVCLALVTCLTTKDMDCILTGAVLFVAPTLK